MEHSRETCRINPGTPQLRGTVLWERGTAVYQGAVRHRDGKRPGLGRGKPFPLHTRGL